MLQQQLNNARKAVRAPNSAVTRGKPSLLFSPQEAADIDIRSIHEIAAKGKLYDLYNAGQAWSEISLPCIDALFVADECVNCSSNPMIAKFLMDQRWVCRFS